VWRARTFIDEQPDPDSTRRTLGCLTFRNGIRVPDTDLHAFATPGGMDEDLLDLWLRACLALEWRGARHTWAAPGPPPQPIPLLGLLLAFADGIALQSADADTPRRGLEPDWPTRLLAGQLHEVHREAVRRFRQVGLRLNEPPSSVIEDGTSGVFLTAALVPRCSRSQRVLRRYLAEPLVSVDQTNTEPAEEMS
jgi:CRISPR-associated protein Csx17